MRKLVPSLLQGDGGHKASGVDEVDILARTIWGEARGEGSAGMEAVAAVVLNRAEISKKSRHFWWGRNIVEICRKPYQFSCWNKDDPNLEKLLGVDEGDLYFATSCRIALRAVNGLLSDPTSGATHYHTAGIMPHWAAGQDPCAIIGRHVFYRLDA